MAHNPQVFPFWELHLKDPLGGPQHEGINLRELYLAMVIAGLTTRLKVNTPAKRQEVINRAFLLVDDIIARLTLEKMQP